jgi:hypothetical protein
MLQKELTKLKERDSNSSFGSDLPTMSLKKVRKYKVVIVTAQI